MKSFRFPLQRVLDWRSLQLRTEEERLASLQQTLTALVRQENALNLEERKCEAALLGLTTIQGMELRALTGFKSRVAGERQTLQSNRAKCEAQIAEQRARLLKARKDCRVLEKLKETRKKEWKYQGDREVEETAAESYISNWRRENESQWNEEQP
jgi:flagellar export protein FliJ